MFKRFQTRAGTITITVKNTLMQKSLIQRTEKVTRVKYVNCKWKKRVFFYKRKYVKTTILNVKEPLLRSDLCCPPAVCLESETQYQIYYIAIGKHDTSAAIESQLKCLNKHRTDWEHFMFWLMFWNPFIVYTLYHSIPFGS